MPPTSTVRRSSSGQDVAQPRAGDGGSNPTPALQFRTRPCRAPGTSGGPSPDDVGASLPEVDASGGDRELRRL